MSTIQIKKLQRKQAELKEMFYKQSERIRSLNLSNQLIPSGLEKARLSVLQQHLGQKPPCGYVYPLGDDIRAFHFDYVKYQVFTKEEMKSLHISLNWAHLNMCTIRYTFETWYIYTVTNDLFFLDGNIGLAVLYLPMLTNKKYNHYNKTDNSCDYGAGYGCGSSYHRQLSNPRMGCCKKQSIMHSLKNPITCPCCKRKMPHIDGLIGNGMIGTSSLNFSHSNGGY